MASTSTSGTTNMTDSRVSVKVKVINRPTKRTTLRGESAAAVVVESSSQGLKDIYMPVSQMSKLKVGNFFYLKDVSVGDNIRMYENSRIMHCGAFSFPKEIEEGYYSPPTVTVMEAIRSPRRRRVSIEGELTNISQVWGTGATRRKVLKLTDKEKTIEVKLWGQQAEIATPPVGQTVRVGCLTIGEYRGIKDANSTDLTEIKEVGDIIEFAGLVEAASFDPQDYSILLEHENDEWRVGAEYFIQIFPLGEFEENVQIKGHRCGRQILDVERIDG